MAETLTPGAGGGGESQRWRKSSLLSFRSGAFLATARLFYSPCLEARLPDGRRARDGKLFLDKLRFKPTVHVLKAEEDLFLELDKRQLVFFHQLINGSAADP